MKLNSTACVLSGPDFKSYFTRKDFSMCSFKKGKRIEGQY